MGSTRLALKALQLNTFPDFGMKSSLRIINSPRRYFFIINEAKNAKYSL